jgi:pilus assembly protein Flp/PilA
MILTLISTTLVDETFVSVVATESRIARERNRKMKNLILRLKIWKDTRGQDLIEYALMAGFVAVAAGAIMPGVATSISTIFSKVASVMSAAALSGS